jgi:hypothetical protein
MLSLPASQQRNVFAARWSWIGQCIGSEASEDVQQRTWATASPRMTPAAVFSTTCSTRTEVSCSGALLSTEQDKKIPIFF